MAKQYNRISSEDPTKITTPTETTTITSGRDISSPTRHSNSNHKLNKSMTERFTEKIQACTLSNKKEWLHSVALVPYYFLSICIFTHVFFFFCFHFKS